MRRFRFLMAALACSVLPAILSAQQGHPPEATPIPSAGLPEIPASPIARDVQAPSPAVRKLKYYFYASAQRHPLTPRDVSMREAVQSLGVDKHRFVRCELKDGTHFIGGITNIQLGYFGISQGIMNGREIKYSELKQPPEPVPAVGEHFVNGLKWTGLVAGCVAVSPLAIIFLPLMLTGVISD